MSAMAMPTFIEAKRKGMAAGQRSFMNTARRLAL